MKQCWCLVVIVCACQLWAQQPQETHVSDGWVRAADSGMVTAAFMRIVNPTMRPDTIVAVQCDCAERSEMHSTVRNADGTMGMRALQQLIVPAQQTVELKPRGLHVMLYNIRRTLQRGDRCQLFLQTQRGTVLRAKLVAR